MTKRPALESLIVNNNETIKTALLVIENGEMGTCFVVEGDVVLGVLTDGDIRRAILAGASVDDPLADNVVTDFVSVEVGAPIEEIQEKLREASIRVIPVLNEKGQLVDFVQASRYHKTPLITLALDGNELEYVTDCIISGWISSQGKYVRQFEDNFSKFIGVKHALAVSNGTDAIELALLSLGIGVDDEVIVPNLTFAASINAVINVGATPVLVDVDPVSFGIDPKEVRTAINEKTKGIIAVHLYGHHCDVQELIDIAQEFDLKLIEDCAEAIGTKVLGKHVGSFGHASTFSFFGNKTITTGEGGMLCFTDDNYLGLAKQIRDHGMALDRRYWHDVIGHNYRMTNLQAAVGCAQLERVEEFLNRKQQIANAYDKHLSCIDGICLPNRHSDAVNSIWLYTILLPPSCAEHKDQIIHALLDKGVESRRVFFPLSNMPLYQPYRIKQEPYRVSNMISERGISLPTPFDMQKSDTAFVCQVLKQCIAQFTKR